MKILLVGRTLPIHVAGGLERHVEDLALGLAARGVNVHLLTAALPESEEARYNSFGIATHEAPSGNPRRYGLRYLLGIGGRIEELQTREKFDLIHAQEFALGFWNPPLRFAPLVLSVHGTITSETPLHPDCWRMLPLHQRPWAWLRFGRRFLYSRFWTRHLKAANRILVDSAFTYREIDRIAPDCHSALWQVPLAVRETGAEPPHFETARRELGWEGTRLLTIGRIEWQKGQTMALEALAGLRGHDWHYTIAGEGSQSAAVRNLIRRLKLEQRVTLMGRLNEATKSQMLSAADLFLWPERTHPAFGLSGLEAMLHNTPVLATPRGAIPEVLGQRGGWIAERATTDACREALAPLLREPEMLTGRRAGLREWTRERFSFDRFIENTIHHYRAVLGLPG